MRVALALIVGANRRVLALPSRGRQAKVVLHAGQFGVGFTADRPTLDLDVAESVWAQVVGMLRSAGWILEGELCWPTMPFARAAVSA
jgi:hypothetical protein